MDKIIDALLNSWEHWDNLEQESKHLAEQLSEDDEVKGQLQTELKSLFQSWIDNEDNFRLDYELNYFKNPEKYDLELRTKIKQVIKSIKV